MGRLDFKRAISLWSVLLIILILAFTPCCHHPFSPLADLENIPESVVINGTKITMQVFLYRDFMPGSYPEGPPLTAIVELTAEDSSRFPDYIIPDKLWVTNQIETWEARFSSVQRPKSAVELNKIIAVASGGPKWEIGTKADVVVRLMVLGKNYFYIKCLNNTVGEVW